MSFPEPQLKTIGTVSAKTIINSPFLVIGSVTFVDFEHPSELEFGTEQRIASHDLIGGSRAVQSLGAFEKDISWDGRLYAGNVAMRFQSLKAMANGGAEQRLKWLTERYDVIVTDVRRKYHQQWFGEYSIIVHVVRDVGATATKPPTTSVDTQTAALANRANAYTSTLVAGDPLALPVQNATNSALANIPGITPIAQAAGSAAIALSSLTYALQAAKTYANGLGSGNPLSQVIAANGLVATLQLIVANVQRGQSPSILETYGGDLHAIAARVYGDPTLALQLGAANGISGTRLPSGISTTLVLPPLTPTRIA